MNHEPLFSAEAINAFVDNQLLAEEKERIYQGLEHDKELSNYVCRLRTLHELIQDAYDPAQLPTMQTGDNTRTLPTRLIKAAAVVLLFVAGGITGWFGHATLQHETASLPMAATQAESTPEKIRSVLLHISSGEPERFDTALHEAEQMLQQARNDATPIQLEILANDSGLNLLRANNGEFASRIAALKQEYGNVTFLACAKTLQHMKEQGVHYDLVPQARIVPSALDEVVKRMESGWVYIHV